MKRRVMIAVAASMALCIAAAGCGQAQSSSAQEETSAAATTEETAAAEQAEEEDMSWEEEDDAYLTGVTAADYVELPEDYKHLEIEAVRPEDPTDEDVEDYIETELNNHATQEEVDRKVQEGDTVSIDYVGKIDGEEFEGGTGSYDLVIGSGSFIEGFEDGLIGAKKGETLDLDLTFPEDYGSEELNGKDVVFTVTVNTITETVVPELKDDYVKSLNLTNSFGQAVTTVSDYRDYVRSNLIEQVEENYENTVKSQIVSTLLSQCSYTQDPPEHMVDKYNYLLTRQLSYYALQNYTDLATLMQYYYGATEDNYLDMIRDMARSYARQALILQAVADEHDLNPDEDEITTEIAGFIEESATIESVDDVDRVIRESLRDDLMTDKVIDYLYDHCRVVEPSEDEEEEADAADLDDTSEAASTAETAEESAEEGSEEKSDDKDSDSDEKDSEEKDSEEKESNDKDSDDKNSDEKDDDKKD